VGGGMGSGPSGWQVGHGQTLSTRELPDDSSTHVRSLRSETLGEISPARLLPHRLIAVMVFLYTLQETPYQPDVQGFSLPATMVPSSLMGHEESQFSPWAVL
jgi:hypothetical protein